MAEINNASRHPCESEESRLWDSVMVKESKLLGPLHPGSVHS
jgi:hypothetical protein